MLFSYLCFIKAFTSSFKVCGAKAAIIKSRFDILCANYDQFKAILGALQHLFVQGSSPLSHCNNCELK